MKYCLLYMYAVHSDSCTLHHCNISLIPGNTYIWSAKTEILETGICRTEHMYAEFVLTTSKASRENLPNMTGAVECTRRDVGIITNNVSFRCYSVAGKSF